MSYRLIIKDAANQPGEGVYSDWKVQIADECYRQCVYCTIGEGVWGGIDHYHIDHYKPKSLPQFVALINDICNLFYACPVCNRFKSNDWPNDPVDLDTLSYPDPSQVDYATIFNLDTKLYTLVSPYKSGSYLIERLFLNRPQLIYHRREQQLNKLVEELIQEVATLTNNLVVHTAEDIELIKSAMQLTGDISLHLVKRNEIRPYKLTEIRKN